MHLKLIKSFNEISDYHVVLATSKHYHDIHHLMKRNRKYTALFQEHLLTLDEAIEEVKARPKNTSIYQKLFMLFYKDNTLYAIIDLMMHYPKHDDAYIGLLMVDAVYQNKGIGHNLETTLIKVLTTLKFKRVELGVVVGNEKAYSFWKRLGYESLREVALPTNDKTLQVTVMEKVL